MQSSVRQKFLRYDIEAQSIKEEMSTLNLSEISVCFSKTTIQRIKDSPQFGRKWWQVIYMINHLCPEYFVHS